MDGSVQSGAALCFVSLGEIATRLGSAAGVHAVVFRSEGHGGAHQEYFCEYLSAMPPFCSSSVIQILRLSYTSTFTCETKSSEVNHLWKRLARQLSCVRYMIIGQ